MAAYKLISADSHIVEPPDLYTTRIEPKFRDRAPRMERLKTPAGREFDAWFIDGQQAVTISLAGHPVAVASLEDVIRSKEAANRPKDLAALPTLRLLLQRLRRG